MQLKQFSLPLKSVSAAEAEMNALLRTHSRVRANAEDRQNHGETESWETKTEPLLSGLLKAARHIEAGICMRREANMTQAGARTFLSAIVCEPANGRTRVSNAARI